MLKRYLLMFAFFFALSLPVLPAFADGGHGDPVDDHDGEVASGSWSMPILLSIGAGIVVAGGAATTKKFNPFQLGVIGLGVAVGLVHLILGFGGDTLLLLNGAGYLALLAAIFMPLGQFDQYNQLIRIGLLGYTIVTLLGYFLMHSPAQFSTIGIVTKGLEIALLGILGLRIWQFQAERRLPMTTD